ncbi:hypothetical protein AQPE_1980 [Aquipluma nitroreducens]|uniref:Uncharacterized protein n=2 Tax=Aquipluma nitroreducens TaxID=2010828 RepID=A0A5K7S8E2_9BACT|nr:hypothetical protein AQPE_1980 [Aquipluma nitroreducens]
MSMAAIAMVLTVFNACTKDELKTSPEEGILKAGKIVDVYLEGDYLVVKNFGIVDSLKKVLQNKSLEEQSSWENQLGLKSAKTFRAQASDKLAGFQNQVDAENYIKELIKEGYFSMRDSSMCYPFYNFSWDCVLNKNGVIKIGDVLYCFQKDAEIAILDGKSTTLRQFLQNSQGYDQSKVKVIPFQKLKSTTPTNYGLVKNVAQSGSNYRFTLGLFWSQSIINVFNGAQWIDVQEGVKYELYYHNETKTSWWWNDNRTYFYRQHISYDMGGNYDPIMQNYFNRVSNYTSGSWYSVNSSQLANVYVDINTWHFGSWYDIGSFLSYPGATIYNFCDKGACDSFGGQNNPITLTVN